MIILQLYCHFGRTLGPLLANLALFGKEKNVKIRTAIKNCFRNRWENLWSIAKQIDHILHSRFCSWNVPLDGVNIPVFNTFTTKSSIVVKKVFIISSSFSRENLNFYAERSQIFLFLQKFIIISAVLKLSQVFENGVNIPILSIF